MALPVRLYDYHVLVKVLTPGSAARRARAVVRQVLQDAGVGGEDLSDAELAVAELAANAETHARPPYELRIVTVDGSPAWCEMVDGDPDPGSVPLISAALRVLRTPRAFDPLAVWSQESGRGLPLIHQLSGGRCHAYPTRTYATGVAGKAVAFALPSTTGPRSQAPGPDRGLSPKAGAHVPTCPWTPAFAAPPTAR